MQKYLPIILFILLSLVWGSSYILIKRGLDAFAPDQVGALRIAFSFFFMLPWAIRALKGVPKQKIKYLAIVGVLGNLLPAFLFAKAQTELASSITGVLSGMTPIFTFLIGLFVFKNRLRFGQMIGLSLGFLGTVWLSFVGNNGMMGSLNVYALLVLLATVFYATSTNVVKVYLSEIKPLHITAVAMLMIGPIATIYLLSTDFMARFATEPAAWSSLGYISILGIVGTAIALALFNKLIQLTSAVYASSVTYLITVVAIFWGVLDGEKLFAMHYLGIAIILLGIFLVNRFRK
ncbi:MAG: DMT family transporter [Flammeovirgaceae bacterium]